jgi:hypothetical protein
MTGLRPQDFPFLHCPGTENPLTERETTVRGASEWTETRGQVSKESWL